MTECSADKDKTKWSLNLIEIPKPCEVPWDSMQGNERVRFCDQCSKNVYNISDVSETEAMKLLIDNEGKVCISMLKRADGTIVSDNCPPLLRPVRNGYRKLAAVCSALIAFGCNHLTAIAADDNKSNEKVATPANKSVGGKQSKLPAQSGSTCGADTLILKPPGKGSVPEPMRLGGAVAPPQVQPGTGAIGSHIEIVGYGVDEVAKSSYPEEVGKEILKQWHPAAALRKKEVMVSFWIDPATGKVSNANVSKSSGNAEADKAALTAVQSAGPFKPRAEKYPRVSSFNAKFPLE